MYSGVNDGLDFVRCWGGKRQKQFCKNSVEKSETSSTTSLNFDRYVRPFRVPISQCDQMAE